MERQRIELVHFFEILVKRRRFIFGVTTGAFVLALVVSLFLPKSFRTTALILPPAEKSGTMAAILGQFGGGGNLGSFLPAQGNGPDLYVGLLKSDAVKDQIIDRFDLLKTEEGATREALYKRLEKKVQVEVGRLDGIISIAVEDREPKRAAEIANAYVAALEELLARLNIASAGKDRGFLEKRLVEAKADLAESEEALKTFQARNKTVDVGEQGKATIEAVAQLHAELGAQEVRLAVLRQSRTENNSEVQEVRGAIEHLRRQISALEGEGELSGALPAVGAMPSLGQEYARLVRELKTRGALLELLTRQYEIARLDEAKNVTGIKIVQSARVPEMKFKPRRTRIVLLVTYAAFIAAVLTTFLLVRIERLPVEQKERWRRVVSGLLGR